MSLVAAGRSCSSSSTTGGTKFFNNGGRVGVGRSVAGVSGETARRPTGRLTGSSSSPRSPLAISSATEMTAFMAATSCTRTKCAPFSTEAATAAAVANTVSSSVPCARKDLREGPVRIGYSNLANSPNRAIISEFCSLRLPKPRPGSSTIRFLSIPERRARLALASKSLLTAAITSGSGGIFAQVSGVPRM